MADLGWSSECLTLACCPYCPSLGLASNVPSSSAPQDLGWESESIISPCDSPLMKGGRTCHPVPRTRRPHLNNRVGLNFLPEERAAADGARGYNGGGQQLLLPRTCLVLKGCCWPRAATPSGFQHSESCPAEPSPRERLQQRSHAALLAAGLGQPRPQGHSESEGHSEEEPLEHREEPPAGPVLLRPPSNHS